MKDQYLEQKKELVDFGKMSLKEYKRQKPAGLVDQFVNDFMFLEWRHLALTPENVLGQFNAC